MTTRLGRALLGVISLLAAVVSSCTNTGDPDRDTLPDARTIATDVSVLSGRLLVLGTENELTTM
ncbi:MAG: hypothetical protein ACRDU7_07560, partial [Acidimicrobiia bacterium]